MQGYSRDHAEVNGEQDEFLKIVGRLEVPFYPTPGNHDLVSGKRDGGDRSFADEYRKRFGPLYYAVELDLISVVVLNTEDGDGRIEPGFSDAQLAWLDRALQKLAMRGRPIAILMHRPLWEHRPTRWDERVQPMLVRHGVDAVIAGHYHALQALPPRDGISFLILGTCGGAIDQHPLAGHLQHTTYLAVDETGAINVHHQIAGTTLPVDWVTKADQALAFRLKSSPNAVVIRGAVPDPLGAPSEGWVDVVLTNPLDSEVEWTIGDEQPPVPWRVADVDPRGEPIERVWTSRTAIDISNPYTSEPTAFRLKYPTEPIVLGPRESKTVRVSATAPAQAAPSPPPPFVVTARFKDSKGRIVPIVMRERLPISRRIELGQSLAAAIDFPVAVWNWSEYDTLEANPKVKFAQGRDGALLDLELTVPDSRLSSDAKPTNQRAGLEDPLGDPLGDAVRVVLGEGPEAREYLVTFSGDPASPRIRALGADGRTLGPTEVLSAVFLRSDRFWTLKLSIRADALPAGARLGGLRLNVGVADNDETFHTQWRWLAPTAVPAEIVVGGQ